MPSAVHRALPSDQWHETQFTTHRAKLQAKLEHSLGVGGIGLFRSKEVRHFRDDLKDEARSQARTDARDEFGKSTQVDATSAAGAYTGLRAQQATKAPAKNSVDKALKSQVNVLLQKEWDGDKRKISARAKTAAIDAAQQLHQQHASMGEELMEGDRAAALRSTATTAALRVHAAAYKAAKTRTRDQKQLAVGKDPSHMTDASAAVAPALAGLNVDVRKQVTKDEVGKKAVEATIEAGSTGDGVGKLGTFLDAVIADPGDQISLAVTLRIPIGNSPGFIELKLSGQAARGIDGAMTAGVPVLGSKNRLEIMGDFSFGGGVELIGFEAGAAAKVFLRGGGDTTKACMDAISYGMYRGLPEAAASWWAGSAAEDDNGKAYTDLYRAEAWAAAMEQLAFAEGGGFVDAGVGLGAHGKVKGTIAGTGIEAAAQLGGSVFNRYNEEALASSLGGAFATPVADEQAARNRRDKAKGKKGGSVSYTFSVGAKFGGQGVNFKGTVSFPTNFSAMGFEITVGIQYASGADATNLDRGVEIANGFLSAAKSMRSLFWKNAAEETTDGAAGRVADALGGVVQMVDGNLADPLSEAMAGAYQAQYAGASSIAIDAEETGLERIAGLATTAGMEIALIGGMDSGGVIARMEIRNTKSFVVNVPVASGGLKVEASKSSRIMALGFDDGKLKAELLGHRLDA